MLKHILLKYNNKLNNNILCNKLHRFREKKTLLIKINFLFKKVKIMLSLNTSLHRRYFRRVIS